MLSRKKSSICSKREKNLKNFFSDDIVRKAKMFVHIWMHINFFSKDFLNSKSSIFTFFTIRFLWFWNKNIFRFQHFFMHSKSEKRRFLFAIFDFVLLVLIFFYRTKSENSRKSSHFERISWQKFSSFVFQMLVKNNFLHFTFSTTHNIEHAVLMKGFLLFIRVLLSQKRLIFDSFFNFYTNSYSHYIYFQT